jgi:4-hydroxybenzoyl-CoA thioesterase
VSNEMHSGPFEREKLIRFHHCDPAGIVFYPQYFMLFNELVEDWYNEGLKVDFADFHTKQRFGIPLARVECDFLAVSRQNDRVIMRLAVKDIGESSVKLEIAVRSVGGEERVRAMMTLVQASQDTRRSVPFTPDMRARIERFRG